MVKGSKAFATRVSAEEAERIEAALEHTGQTQSDLVGDGLRYYIQENPDDVPAFRSESEGQDPPGELDIYVPTVEWNFGD